MKKCNDLFVIERARTRHKNTLRSQSMRTSLTAILKGVLDRKKCRICSLIHFFGGLEKLIIIVENNISHQKINLDRDVGAQCKDWNESGGCWKRPCGNCGLCRINYVCLWKVDRSYFRWSKGKKRRFRYELLSVNIKIIHVVWIVNGACEKEKLF